MRTTTHFLFALTSLLIAAPACDVEEDLEFVDEDEDESIAFRCGSPCLGSNSPYLGAWDITNQSVLPNPNHDAVSPDGELSMRWTGVKGGNAITYVHVDHQGAATVAVSGGPTEPIAGARFNVTVKDGLTTETGKIWFSSATATPGVEDPSFTVTRYDIRTNINPGPDHVSFGEYEGDDWWSVCPVTVGGNNTAVLLSHTHADQKDDWGTVRLKEDEFVIACDGHALAKGVTQLNVIPRNGSTRSYGYGHYSSLIQGWQALFDDTSWTYLGAKVGVVDTVNSPPLFDTRDVITPPPILGQYHWILESVYKDTGTNSRGAQCKFTGHVQRPGGDHRNSAYDAPVAKIPGWSSMPECSGALNQYGDVAFYSVSLLPILLGG